MIYTVEWPMQVGWNASTTRKFSLRYPINVQTLFFSLISDCNSNMTANTQCLKLFICVKLILHSISIFYYIILKYILYGIFYLCFNTFVKKKQVSNGEFASIIWTFIFVLNKYGFVIYQFILFTFAVYVGVTYSSAI